MYNYKDDLTSTVQELSHAYEELSLLYRVAGMFASLSIDDICSRMVDEAVGTIGVKTAAVLFLDDKTGDLYTKISRGSWDNARTFSRDAEVIWKTIHTRKPSAFCRIAETPFRDYIPGVRSLMVCPIQGKVKTIGALVVAGGENHEEAEHEGHEVSEADDPHRGAFPVLLQDLFERLLGTVEDIVRSSDRG